MFEINDNELDLMVSQIVIPDKKVFGGARPFAFKTRCSDASIIFIHPDEQLENLFFHPGVKQ